eukprot:COSAG02_NODE_89_length_38500_cov_61.646910_4_plen_2440_part_00
MDCTDIEVVDTNGILGRHVSLRRMGGGEEFSISFCEIEIYGSIGCIECPKGKFASSTGSQQCETCPENTFAGVGAAECLPCVAGEFQGDLECLACVPGQYDHDSQASTPCELCPIGQFLTSSGVAGDESVCAVCPPGKSSTAGAIECATCSPGDYDHDNDGSTPCLPCPAGAVRVPCTDDWSGELQVERMTCLGNLPDGETSREEVIRDLGGCSGTNLGSQFWKLGRMTSSDMCPVSCGACTSGTPSNPDGFANADGTGSCTTCRAGTYAPGGSTVCEQCQPGTHDHDLDASTPCEPCPANTFSRDREATACTPCPSHASSEPGAASCSCSTGSPVVNAYDIGGRSTELECATCPAGTVQWSGLRLQEQLEYLAGLDPAPATGRSRKTCQQLCDEDDPWCLGKEESFNGGPVDDITVCASREPGNKCFGGWESLAGSEPYHGFDQAETICSAIGARLCTVDEIRTNEGNAAGHDACFNKRQTGWSSEECQVDICGEGAVTTGGTAPEGTPCAFPFIFDGVVYNECMWTERETEAASIYDIPSMEGPVCLTGNGVDGQPPTANLDTVGGWFTWTTVNTENKELRHGGDASWDRWSPVGVSLQESKWPQWGHCNCQGVPGTTTHTGHFVAGVTDESSRWHRICPLHCDPQEGGEGGKICNSVDPSDSELGMSWVCPAKCIDGSSSKPYVQCCADSETENTAARCAAFAACANEDASTDGMTGACYQAAVIAGTPALSHGCRACWTARMTNRPAELCAACVADYVAVHDACVSSPPGSDATQPVFDISCVQCRPGTYDHDLDASTPCEHCPAAKYSVSSGATECIQCEQGRLAPVGSTSADSCVATPQYMGCWQDRESLTQKRDLPTVRKRMGVRNMGCRDLVNMMGCDADISEVSPGLQSTGNISAICPVTCGSCPEINCTDTDNGGSYSCETLIDYYDGCHGEMPNATRQSCQLSCGLCPTCEDDPGGILAVAVAPSTALCRMMCTGHRYMGVQGADMCFCSDSYGHYGPAKASHCGDMGSECAHGGAREMECAQSVKVRISFTSDPWQGEVHAVAEYGYHTALRSWNIDNPPENTGGVPVSQSGCGHQLASSGDAIDMNCPIAVAGEEVWSPLVNKHRHETVYDVPVSTAAEHTLYFWGAKTESFLSGGWNGGFWEILDSCGGTIGGGPTDGLVTGPELGSFTWSTQEQCCGGCELANAVFELPDWNSSQHADNVPNDAAATSGQHPTMSDDGSFATKSVVSIEAACPAERAACIAEDGCIAAFKSAIASPDRPPPVGQGDDDAMALIVCLQQVASPSLALMRGCTDPLATNYNPEAIDPDPSDPCVYDCVGLSSSSNFTAGADCFILAADSSPAFPASPWSTAIIVQGHGPIQTPLGTASADCRYEFIAGEHLSFADAEKHCAHGGGHLASIHTEAQSQAILRTVVDDATHAWIGLHDRVTEAGCDGDGFVWSDASGRGPASMWGEEAPDAIGCVPAYSCQKDCSHAYPSSGVDPTSGRTDADCVVFDIGEGTWKDTNCYKNEGLICGFQCHNTSDPAARCDYQAYRAEIPWRQAEDYCISLGGHLATITSTEDLVQLEASGVADRKYWIGLNDLDFEMGCDGMDGRGGIRPGCDPPTADCKRDRDTPGWIWSDGTFLGNFTVWRGDQPDSEHCGVPAPKCSTDCSGACLAGLSKEDCVELHQQQWDDVECNDEKPFVCGYPCVNDVSMAQMIPIEIAGGKLATRYVQFRTSLAGHSAAINVLDTTLRVAYCQFTELSQVAVGAGAILASNSHVALEHSVIEGNANTGRGAGGVYITSNSRLLMTNARVEANVAIDEMGLDATNAKLGLPTVARAAGLVVDDSSSAEVFKCRFLRNRGGSVVVAKSSNAMLLNSVFRGNFGGSRSGSHVSSAGVSVWLGSSVALHACLFERNHGETAADLIAEGVGTTALVDQTAFKLSAAHVTTSSYAGGVLLVEDGAAATIANSTFMFAQASGPKAAGALFVSDATLTVTDSELRSNRQVAGTTQTSAGAGGIYSENANVDLQRTSLIENIAAETDSTAFADQVFSHHPVAIKALDVLYEPYIESQSAMIQPGAVLGSLRGSCKEVDPCPAGYSCTYDRYALTCEPCPGATISVDGLSCSPCPMGTGPMTNKSGCLTCQGSNYSAFGVCLPCSETLVVDQDHKGCHECGVHRTAVVVDGSTASGAQRFCACEDRYINSSEILHICYADGFDLDQRDRAIAQRDISASSTGQECEACPTDITGSHCLICEGGKAVLAAGFTIPTLDQSGTRRRLSAGDGTVSVFRCHIELELAQTRCPANPEVPGTCAAGYTGYLCDSCSDGYGMSPDRACEPCSGAGYTSQSLLVLLATLGGVAFGTCVLGKVWKSFPLKHLARCAFQPGRILITYSQVTSQLGDVLDFRYPGIFGQVVEFIRPIMVRQILICFLNGCNYLLRPAF